MEKFNGNSSPWSLSSIFVNREFPGQKVMTVMFSWFFCSHMLLITWDGGVVYIITAK
jgi:hypothetical protein